MANWIDLKAAVASIVKTNGNKEITGQLLQNVLNNIISNVGLNSTFAGIATPETNPGTPDGNVFYLATTAGTYSNFNGIVINSGEAVILEWKGSWVKKDSGFTTKEKLSELGSYTYNIPVDKQGYYIKKDGEIVYIGDKKFCVSEFINVVEGDIFIIENATELANYQSYALYDENKNLILLSNVSDIILTIPNGVKYVVFSRNTNADLSNQYKCRRVFNKYLDMLFYIGDKSVYIRKATFITKEGAFNDKSASSYVSTDYISVKPSQILYIKGKAENLAVLYAFYREDKTLISTGLTEGLVRVPENAYYVAACSDKSADYGIRPATTEYIDKQLNSLNTKIGDTNFYSHKTNVGYSIGATLPNYILINVPNSKKAICGIQFKICTFVLNAKQYSNTNVLAYFYPTETEEGLSYASVQVQGGLALNLKFLIKDGSFYIAIQKGYILSTYSAVYVDTLFSWFSKPIIANENANIVISEAESIEDYNIAYEYSYKPNKVISNVTDLNNIYNIQNHLEGTYASYAKNSEYSTYPVADYGSWTDSKTGACVIKFPIYKENQGFFEFDINVFRYQTRGCTLKVCGFYTAEGFQGGKFVRVVSGSLNTIYGKLRVGFHDNRICLILGDTTNKWQFLKFDISNVRTYMNSGKPTPFTEGWNLEFVSDLTDYNVEDVDYKIDKEIIPNLPSSIIQNFEDEVRKVLPNRNALSEYVDVNYIRAGLSEFFKNLYAKEKNTPYNLLFLGDSITNFQNGWVSGADKELPKVSNDKPLCMYNEYTFTNRLWALLNPNALDRANRNKTFGGNMTFIKATSNDVVKSGTWVNSYNYTTGQYNLPTIGGHPTGGIKDFLFSTDSNAYLEFTIPANSKGFSVVTEVQNGARTYNSTSYNPSTSVEVTLDGVLLGTISMIPESPYTQYQKRFDFVIDSPTASTRKVRIQNKEADKWVFIWGVESWTDVCVRPINNAFAGASMFNSSAYNNYVFAHNPDMIVHEANLLNDTRIDLIATEKLYDAFYSKLSEKGIPTIVLVTHAPSNSSTTITVDADKCPNMEDAEKTPRYYNQYAAMIKRVCGRYNIPYINVFQYQYDLYNGVIPSDLFVDGIHLSAKGHDMYKLLINYAFENNY